MHAWFHLFQAATVTVFLTADDIVYRMYVCLIGGLTYAVRILTGAEPLSGTRNNVFLELVGSKARTGRVRLSGMWNDTANQGSYDDFLLTCKDDLGGVLVIVLENRKSLSLPEINSSWFVDFVICHDYTDEKEQNFPCYRWIDEGDFLTFTSNTSKYMFRAAMHCREYV